MQVREITNINDIRNEEVFETAKNMKSDEILLMFGDGTYSIVSSKYNGIIYDRKNDAPISRIPIDTNWRPINVGIRLYNGEVRYCRSNLFQNLYYITWYYSKQ